MQKHWVKYYTGNMAHDYLFWHDVGKNYLWMAENGHGHVVQRKTYKEDAKGIPIYEYFYVPNIKQRVN